MKPNLYEQYLSLKKLGIKTEAKIVLDEFIASFQSFEEKENWVRQFLEGGDFGHKIRYEIYTNLVFPILLKGYSQKDVWSIFWLAKTSQNLYTNASLHAVIEFKSEFQLLAEAYALEPTEQIRLHLLKELIRWFNYSQHEWPSGILYGVNGASIEECDGILLNVEFARELDQDNVYEPILDDFEAKVRAYQDRLAKRDDV